MDTCWTRTGHGRIGPSGDFCSRSDFVHLYRAPRNVTRTSIFVFPIPQNAGSALRDRRVFGHHNATVVATSTVGKWISTDYSGLRYTGGTTSRFDVFAQRNSPFNSPEHSERARYNSLMVNTVAVATLNDPQHVFIIFFFIFFSRYALHHLRRVLHGLVNIGRIFVRTHARARARVLYYRGRTKRKETEKEIEHFIRRV